MSDTHEPLETLSIKQFLFKLYKEQGNHDDKKFKQVQDLEAALAKNFYFTVEQFKEINNQEFKDLMPMIPDFLIDPLQKELFPDDNEEPTRTMQSSKSYKGLASSRISTSQKNY